MGGRDGVIETDVQSGRRSGPTGPQRQPYMDTKVCTRFQLVAVHTVSPP